MPSTIDFDLDIRLEFSHTSCEMVLRIKSITSIGAEKT